MIRTAFAAAALALAAFAALPASAQTIRLAPDLTEEQFLVELRQAQALDPAAAVLIEGFPADYRRMELAVLARLRIGDLTVQDVERLRENFVNATIEANLPAIAFAPPEHIVAMLRAQADLAAAVQPVDPVRCALVAEAGGVPDAETLGPKVAEAERALGLARLRAMAAGARTPHRHGEVQDADVDALLAQYARQGGDARWLAAMQGEGDLEAVAPKVRCASSLAWLRAFLALPRDAAVRVTAANYTF